MRFRPVALVPLALICSTFAVAQDQMTLTMPGADTSRAVPAPVTGADPSHTRQFLVATGGGALLATATGLTVWSLTRDGSSGDGHDRESPNPIGTPPVGLYLTMFTVGVAYPLGSALALKLTGQRGSFAGALLAGSLAEMLGLALAQQTSGASFVISVPIGSVIGWNSGADPPRKSQ